MNTRNIFLYSVLLILLPIATSYGQGVTLPSSSEVGRTQERFDSSPKTSPADESVAPVIPEVSNNRSPEDDDTPQFILNSILVRGSTVYDEYQLSALYNEYIGKQVTLATLYEISDRITKMYHEDGYILSRTIVPSQEITDGRVSLRIVEGFVSDVTVDGDLVESKLLSEAISHIKSMQPLNSMQLERIILLLNDLAGMNVTSILQPLPHEKATEGAVGMKLVTSRQPFTSSFKYDNYGSRYLGPFQLSAFTGMNNRIAEFDRISFTAAITTPYKELQFAELGYRLPLNSNGTNLSFSISGSNSQPGYRLEDADIDGKSLNASVTLSHALLRSRQTNLFISAGLDLKHSKTDILNTELYDDRVRIARASASFDHRDKWAGVNLADVTVSKGIDILGARETGSLNLSRQQGHSDFLKIEGSVARLQQLTDTLTLYGVATGQWADSPLLSSEEYGFGGSRIGRGYDSSEITGDHGLSGSVELRYSLGEVFDNFHLQPFAFYDIGKVWNRDTGGENLSAASAGFGFRFNFLESISGELIIAQPLTKEADSPTSGDGDDPRGYFSITYRY